MDRKTLFMAILFAILVLIDSSVSGFLKVYISLSFLSVTIVYLDYIPSIYFALISGVVFDIFFASYIGQFTFPIILITLFLQTIKSIYAIHKLILSFIFIVLLLGAIYAFSRNRGLFDYLVFSAILIPIWSVILRSLGANYNAKRRSI
jgi:hypothetical protein